jgi:chromosome segregation ATPase
MGFNFDQAKYLTDIFTIIKAVNTVLNYSIPIISPAPENLNQLRKMWVEVKTEIGKWDSVHVSLGDTPETCMSVLKDSATWVNMILDEIQDVINGDQAFLPQLKSHLQKLQNTFGLVPLEVNNVLKQLGDYSVSLNEQISNTGQIKTGLDSDIHLDENTKAKFQSEIDNLNSEINKDYAKIAGIASAMTIGSAVIVSTISIGGLGVFLVPFMLGGDAAGIYEIAQLGIEINNDKKKIDGDNQEIAQYTAALAVLRTAETDIGDFYASITSISDNIEALSGVWKELSQANTDIYSQFKESNQHFDLSDWKDLKTDVTELSSRFSNLNKLFELISISDIQATKVQLNENMNLEQIQKALDNPPTLDLTDFLFSSAA